jgi:type VI secretion system secreted protein VgrG
MPAWRLPEQTNLSGIRSRELSANDGSGGTGGARGNHLALDDHPGKIQAQLKSDHLSSSLSLGHIGRIDDTAGRKDDRGEGAELRTDGHAAVRAARGLLLTTETRPDAQAHITDLGETVARLTAARDLHERQSQTAQEAKAHEAGDQDAVTKILREQNDAIKGKGGSQQGAFPELSEPHLVLASAAGIHSTAAGSTHIASITHNALSSGGHTSVSAGKSFLVSVKEAARLFAYKAIRLTAATAGIDIVALQNSIKLLAKLDIKLEANKISITAKEEILINGGSSFTKWSASGIVHGTKGLWREHAGIHSYAGPKNLPVPFASLPIAEIKQDEEHRYVQKFDVTTLVDYAPMAAVLQGQPYRIYLPDETLIQQGNVSETTAQVRTKTSTKVRCEIGAGDWTVHEHGYDHEQANGSDAKQNHENQGAW